MSATSVVTTPLISQSAKDANDSLAATIGGLRLYELTYKAAGQTRREIFTAKDQTEAMALGQEYCTVHGSRFIFVSLWLRDLRAAIEKKKAGV